MSDKHNNWRCDKCDATYQSPIPLTAVNCPTCSRQVGRVAKWMKPDEKNNG